MQQHLSKYIKTHLASDPEIPLLGILRGSIRDVYKDICSESFLVKLFIVRKLTKISNNHISYANWYICIKLKSCCTRVLGIRCSLPLYSILNWKKKSFEQYTVWFCVPPFWKISTPKCYNDFICAHAKLLQFCPTLCKNCSPQAPLSMGFSRQEYWSGLPCPPPGDLPKAGIEPASQPT